MTEGFGRGGVVVRKATTPDIEDVLTLVERLVAFGPPVWRDATRMIETDREAMASIIRDQSDDPVVLVARDGGGVAGFIHLRSQTDPYHGTPTAHVSDLVVAENREGRGLAGRLLREAEAWALARGRDWLTISVFDANVRAAALYERAGFGRDILRLVKPIDGASRRPPA